MDYMQQETYLLISTNITPQKRDGRNCVLKFFHRDWRRCTMSYPSMVKTISLGPHWTKTLSVCTRLTSVFLSMHFTAQINLERPFVCIAFIFILWDHHYLLYMRMLLEIWVEISCMLLYDWEKGYLCWFLMTHIVA